VRTDTAAFAAKNVALAKRPRYVIELAFDAASTILWYFTSHTDSALPPGASSILGVIEAISGTSQTLNPDTANASIGNINFMVVDRASIVSSTLGSELVLGRSTRRQRVRVYVGFEDLAWADYTLVQTQLVSEIAYSEGAYKFVCADIQREMRKDLFELAKTTLAQSLSESATTIEVFTTAAFQTVAHGTSYSDAPSSTVGYVKIQDEVIRYTGKTPTQFTGCTRGALNTRAVEHAVDTSTSADRRTSVEDYVYLEMPAVKLMYALLTGTLHGQGGAVLPTSWNLGISTAYVRLADFTGIGLDLWNTASDAGFVVRLEGLAKQDGKKFIETELALLAGLFMPVYADGALGLRRMSNVLSGASYIKLLDESNIVSHGDLVHDFNALRNVLQINWNWETAQKDFTRVNLLVDAASVTIHQQADPLKLKFRGLHGSIHSSTILAQRFDALRDRYTGPPLRMDAKVLPSLNSLEVGDVVRVKPSNVRDFVANTDLDRSFEIQNIAIDWVTGELGLKLFASSQAPGVIPATADSVVLSDAWYSSAGTTLASVLTITGSNPGHVTAGGTLTGTTDMNAAGSIFYYPGDLVIDPGVTVNVVNNVQLRVKGFLQNNGTLNAKGNGIAAGGTAGFLGTTEAGGALVFERIVGILGFEMGSRRTAPVVGLNATVPALSISWDGTTLSGIPTDLRGSSGGTGGQFVSAVNGAVLSAGGAGGKGGAGIVIVSRGFAQGVAGVIDVSGADGNAVAGVSSFIGLGYAGSGAGGAPGALVILLDGASTTATGLTEAAFVALHGRTPIPAVPLDAPSKVYSRASDNPSGTFYSFFVGTGDGTTFPLPSLSGSRGGNRVQFVPGNLAPTPDLSAITLAAPTNISLSSGTAELLVQGDGTIVPRIRVTWTPSLDSRTVGYDLQFKPSSETIWSSVPPVLGQSSSAAFIANVADGVNYDVRLRAAGPTREVSAWVTITGYFVIGKTGLPSDVELFTIEGTKLSWTLVADADVVSGGGYLIKYQPGTSRSWGDAIQINDGVLTSSPYDMLVVPTGPVTIMIKAVDSSGNESQNASYIVTDLGDPFVANVVETFDRKAAGFPGTKTGCTVSGGNLVSDSITPLAWKPNDQAAAWSTDSSTLAWAVTQYATMTYVDTLTFTQALAGSQLTIQYTIQGDPWSLEYRENSAALAWSGDATTLAWSADDSTLAWTLPPYLPWPGNITVRNSIYDFRIIAGQANTQGIVSELTMTVDAPDIEETLNDIVISAGGTRLPITKSYVVIKNVQLTVQNDGGSAISARIDDKVTTVGAGPLVHGLDATGANTSALVDARIQGN
jgi:hypothetical protein